MPAQSCPKKKKKVSILKPNQTKKLCTIYPGLSQAKHLSRKRTEILIQKYINAFSLWTTLRLDPQVLECTSCCL